MGGASEAEAMYEISFAVEIKCVNCGAVINFAVPYDDKGNRLVGFPCPRCAFPLVREWGVDEIKITTRASPDEVYRSLMERKNAPAR